MYLLTQKQTKNSTEQEQSLTVNWTQTEVSLHWRVSIQNRKEKDQNTNY